MGLRVQTTPPSEEADRLRAVIRRLLNTPPKPREEVKDDARAAREVRKVNYA
jgi:hypothetical protein